MATSPQDLYPDSIPERHGAVSTTDPFPLPNSSGLAEPPCFFSAPPLPNTEVTPRSNLPYLTGSFFGLESFHRILVSFIPFRSGFRSGVTFLPEEMGPKFIFVVGS